MSTDLDLFNAHRARLFGVAYRMLGTRADAEDIVQDAWLRWHQADRTSILNTEAWLVTTVTRLCIDRLRTAKVERAAYEGPWLPEPMVAVEEATPEWIAEFASDVSMAFLTLLERLAPEERAAFLLHDVFEVDYPDIARMLSRTQAACRQMVHRARERVRQPRPRFEVSRENHMAMLHRFMDAARSGDPAHLSALFTEDVSFTGDGGGKVVSARHVLYGAERVARLFHVIERQYGDRMTYRIVDINGEPGLLRYVDGQLDSVSSFEIEDGRIVAIYSVRNPDKLRNISLH